MGPSKEALALADFLIERYGLTADRYQLAYAIMEHEEKAMRAEPEQVGEVQGDARAQFEVWCDERGYNRSPAQNNCGITVPERYAHPKAQIAWEAWQAALAARQPGAQEPEVEFQCRLMDVKTDLPTENWHHSPTFEENPGRGTHYWVQYRKRYIYYTQPAQGIDLGQFRDRIKAAIDRIVNHQCLMRIPVDNTDPDIVLADILRLIDSQRDAAPGVE